MSTSSVVPSPSLQSPAAARRPIAWISCAEHRAALQQQLEAVVVGRIVAAGDLDAAVDVEIMGREIEHRASGPCRSASTSMPLSVSPRTSAASSMPRVGAAVAPDRDRAWRLRRAAKRAIGPAERISIGLGERVADDSANVIFAQDGGVELCVSSRCLTQRERLVQPAVAASFCSSWLRGCRARQSSRAVPGAR